MFICFIIIEIIFRKIYELTEMVNTDAWWLFNKTTSE